MSILILDLQRTEDECDLDTQITSLFSSYVWQYTTIPDDLFLLDPRSGASRAIILIEKAYLMDPTANLEESHIRFALYHPRLKERLIFETDTKLSFIRNIICSDEVDCELQHLAHQHEVSAVTWINKLKELYPPRALSTHEQTNEIVDRYTMRCQSLFLH